MMKKLIVICLLFSVLSGISEAKTQKIKIGLNNGKMILKTKNVTIKSPQLMKNKYAKMIRIDF